MVDLTQIGLATEEDKDWEIDHWARLFKAKTWEDLRMISKKNDTLREASEALYVMNADQMIRERCRAREDYYRIQNTMKYKLDKATAEKEEITSKYEELTSKYEEIASENQKLTSENKELASKVGNLSSDVKALTSQLAEFRELLLEHGISGNDK